MVSIAFGIAWGLLALSALGYTAVTVQVHRHEQFPGRRSFLQTSGLLAIAFGGITLLSILTQLNALGTIQGPLLLILTFATLLSVPLTWVRFALQYTGQRFPTGRQTLLRLGIPVILTVGTIAIALGVEFLRFGLGLEVMSESAVGIVGAVLDYSTALTAFYLAALLVVGASIVAWTSYSFRHLSNDGGILVGIGVVVPWVAVVMPVATGLFTEQLLVFTYHVAVGGAVGAGALWMVVDRYELFRKVPAAGTIGRDVTVEDMNDPVLVTDGSGRVIDLNNAAEEAFQVSVESIGEPLNTIFDGTVTRESLLAETGDRKEVAQQTRTFESTASELQDEHGRLLGHSFVFHDVTARKQREQRIQVLNRVLRHNLRNDLNAVNGYADLLERELSRPNEYLRRIQEMTSNLIAIGEKARDIEAVITTDQQYRTAPVSEILRQAIDDVQSAYSDCTIRVESSADEEPANESVLSSILRELIENACRHTDADEPVVEVTASVESGADRPIVISIADQGPGIPDHELTPLQEGTETALEHGSGLGLWLVEWGTTTLNGHIEFDSNEPRGTVATLRLPPET